MRPTELISNFLIGSRMPPADTAALHEEIEACVKRGASNDEINALLAKCKTDECAVCGSICCPHGEPLHFHHDGCPACESPVPPPKDFDGEQL